MTIITIPSSLLRGKAPTSARHVVTRGDHEWWKAEWYEGDEESHVCVVPMSAVDGYPGYFGCCCHGVGFRTEDFPLQVAKKLASSAKRTDSNALVIKGTRFEAVAGPDLFGKYLWKSKKKGKYVYNKWATRSEVLEHLKENPR